MSRLLLFFTLAILGLTIPKNSRAQQKSMLTGRVWDSEPKKAMGGATVFVLRLSDSSRVGSAISDADGAFRLTNLPVGDSLIVAISFSGYTPFSGVLILSDSRFVMQSVILKRSTKSLDEVVVTGRRSLTVIKKDTVEFKASAFKTPPNSKAKDLLRRIPGLLIDGNGHLTYNGRPVSRIVVDGKVFMGENGQVALQNIPVEMIDKIQISDAMTAEDKLIDPGRISNEQALNIQLKEGKKYFGNAMAGIGTDGRYDVNGFANRSRGKERVTVNAGVNNVNRLGGMSPEMAGLMVITNGGGITKDISGGLEYENEVFGNINLTGGYHLDRPVTYKESALDRKQLFLQDSSIRTNSVSNSLNKSVHHGFDLMIRKQESLRITPTFQYDAADNVMETQYSTHNSKDALVNQQNSRYRSKQHGTSVGTDLFYKLPLTSRQSIVFDGSFKLDNKTSNDGLEATTTFFRSGLGDSVGLTHQDIDQQTKNISANLGGRYDLQLKKGWFLTAGEHVTVRQDVTIKNTFQLDSSGKRIAPDTAFSNHFISNVVTNAASFGGGYIRNGWRAVATTNVVAQDWRQKDETHHTELRNSFVNVMPSLSVSLGDMFKKSISLDFGMDYTNPSPDQLQPVKDNTNPLVQKLGNPDLKPSVNYRTSLRGMRMFTGKTTTFIQAGLSYTPVSNKIVSNIRYDSLGRQLMQYANVNGTYGYNGDLNLGVSRKFGKQLISLGGGLSGQYSQDRVYLNGQLAGIRNVSLTPSGSLTYSRDEVMDLMIMYNPSITNIRYEKGAGQDQRYTIHNLMGTLGLNGWRRLKWNNSVSYRYNGSLPESFSRSTVFWNMYVSYLFLKGRNAEIRASGFDLLKQNRNVTRTAGDNYIEDSQANNLQRYFMLSLAYNFSGLKGTASPAVMR
jgi:hypothetical protein